MKRRILVCALVAMLVASSAVLADDTPATESAAPASSAETAPAAPTEPAAPHESAESDGVAGNVQFLLGQTYLHDFWKPLDEPMSFAVEVDFAPKTSPVRVA